MNIPRNPLAAVVLAAATEDKRYYLKGVHIISQEGQSRATASDGALLATSVWDEEPGEAINLIIPVADVQTALKAHGKNPLPLTLTRISTDPAMWQLGAVVFKPIEGNYPDARRVWPKDPGADNITPPAFQPALWAKVEAMRKVGKWNTPHVWYTPTSVVFSFDGEVRVVIMGMNKDPSRPNFPEI